MRRPRTTPSLCVLLVAALCPPQLGCGDEVVEASPARGDDGGAGGDQDVGGQGGDTSAPLELEGASAPDEYTVEVRFTATVGDVLSSPATYVLASDVGEAPIVKSVSVDPETFIATLTTSRQRLGSTLTLSLALDGPLGERSVDLPAADTAVLWANDFGTPDFANVEVHAVRRAIGEHSVVYIEEDMEVDGIDEAVEMFDTKIYPIETELFTAAPDIDDNGRVLLLGLNGGRYYGGYFNPVNTMDDKQAFSQWGYHSNEMEMVYVNVASGYLNVDLIVAHEFGHLLYHERHGFESAYWDYHDEGLAECAVGAVQGVNAYALQHYLTDPYGTLGQGLSLVNWEWANYDHYALAYVFWTYVAGRLGGPAGYGALFDHDGDPATIAELLEDELGEDFASVQRDMLLATWLREPSGPHGFNGMLDLMGSEPPTAPSGTTSVDLEPFAGTLLRLPGQTSVDYPGNQGPNIRYAGVNAAGEVDLVAPFDVSGGVLAVLNTHFDPNAFPAEPSGPGAGAELQAKSAAAGALPSVLVTDRARLHPPPLDPRRMSRVRAWRESLRDAPLPSLR